MNRLAIDGLKVSASLDVVGWSPDECLLNEGVADAISRYVSGALRAGLGAAEIEADLLDAWGTRFSQVSVEVTRSFRRASALVFAVATPGAAASRVPEGHRAIA